MRRPAELVREAKEILQSIAEARMKGRDAVVLGRIEERVKEISAEIQKSYSARFADSNDDPVLQGIVPLPLKGTGATGGIDRRILEEGLPYMISRADRTTGFVAPPQPMVS